MNIILSLHLNVDNDQSASWLDNLLDPAVPQEHKLLSIKYLSNFFFFFKYFDKYLPGHSCFRRQKRWRSRICRSHAGCPTGNWPKSYYLLTTAIWWNYLIWLELSNCKLAKIIFWFVENNCLKKCYFHRWIKWTKSKQNKVHCKKKIQENIHSKLPYKESQVHFWWGWYTRRWTRWCWLPGPWDNHECYGGLVGKKSYKYVMM